jgi:hypothetical protein
MITGCEPCARTSIGSIGDAGAIAARSCAPRAGVRWVGGPAGRHGDDAGRPGTLHDGALGRGHLAGLAVAGAQAELLLDLQVGEASHCLRRHRTLRRLVEEPTIAGHGHVEPLLDLDVLQVRPGAAQVREGVAFRRLGAAGDQHRDEHHRQREPDLHGCTPAVCRRDARS